MRHCLHVILGRKAERHRPHAHAFDIVKMHAANAGSKFIELPLDVPFFHAGNVGCADLGIPRPVRIVARDASLEDFLAASGGIRRAKAASGETQSTDQEQENGKRDSMVFGFLSSAHTQKRNYGSGMLTAVRIEDKLNLRSNADFTR